MKAFRMKESLQLLHDACRGVCNTVFVSTRPKELRERMAEFIVVSLPAQIRNRTVGLCGITETTCRIAIYVRDKGGSEDISRIDELADKVVSLFPISRGGICASDPQVVLEGSDGNGFHVALIQSALKTY